MLSIFLGALDQTIVAVALPAISTDFGRLGLVSWVISGYMVGMTVATPIYGKLGDLYGRRRMMLVAICLFTSASVLCAVSPSLWVLILLRAAQGIGAGGLLSIGQAIIGDLVSPRERGRYQGYFSGMYALASIAGPIVGGVLTQYVSWRWIFGLNLPLGLWAMYLAFSRLDGLPSVRRDATIDYVGIALTTIGLTTLLLAMTLMNHGSNASPYTNGALFVLSLLCFVLLVPAQRKAVQPFIPLRLFATASSSWALCISFFSNFQVIALSLLIPLRYQIVVGSQAGSAALHLMPLAMGLPIGAYLGGKTTSRTGRCRPQMLAGAIVMPFALATLAFIDPGDHWLSGVVTLIAGISAGVLFPTSLVTVQNVVPRSEIGVATATTSLFRSLGGTVGVTLASAVLLGMMQNLVLPTLGSWSAHSSSIDSLFKTLGEVSGTTLGLARVMAASVFRSVLLFAAVISAINIAAAWALPDQTLRDKLPESDLKAQLE
ncbi:MDR family MFS transporter [Caballeronia sp. dw_19]|uniref:MDR family MFS transporter n=1 Tax=Caballeronia sp. dw_19 TaxID=2719791 RepID=UPI001BD46E97|nr:MDR family MFS transporter [Caballeronia sp. dw_19]